MIKKLQALIGQYRFQLLIILIAIPYLILQAGNGGDFRILLKGAGYLRQGQSPYGIVMHMHDYVYDVFLYSPFVAFIMIPFTYPPPFIPTFIFCCISLLVLFRVWAIMSIWLDVDKLSEKQRRWWHLISIVLILRFLLHNFENTQMNILILYLSLEGLYQILLRGKNSGSVLLALGICLKILPLIFIPYLLYRRKVSAVIIIMLCCALLILLPALYFGIGLEMQLVQGWWTAINPLQDKYNAGQNGIIIFHCISSIIPVYFSDSSYQGFSVNIAHLDKSQLFVLINIIRAALFGFTGYFLWIGYRAKNHPKVYLFWELAYIFMLIPLIFPNQNKYAYTNLLPAFAYVAYYMVNTFSLVSQKAMRDRVLLLIMLTAVIIPAILTADIFWGLETGRYFQFLKLITVGAIFLIPVLALFSPRRLYTLSEQNAENRL